jgi:hypothetical protein
MAILSWRGGEEEERQGDNGWAVSLPRIKMASGDFRPFSRATKSHTTSGRRWSSGEPGALLLVIQEQKESIAGGSHKSDINAFHQHIFVIFYCAES